jgi:molybdenum cofactor cytidylyltransferase
MGQAKQLLRMGENTILEHTLHNHMASQSEEIILVLGYRANKILKSIPHESVIVVHNPEYSKGMSKSIIHGLSHVNPKTDGILIALADQPLIDTNTINRLITAFLKSNKGIIIPLYRSKRGNPVIFSAAYREELMNLSGDTGGREIIKRHQYDILEVPVKCEWVVQDIDTMDEYRQAMGKIK